MKQHLYCVCCTSVMCFQRQLSDAVMELGEIDQALDDVLGLLHETEADLLHSDSVSGDANYCELFIAKVQVVVCCCLLSCFWVQWSIIDLNWVSKNICSKCLKQKSVGTERVVELSSVFQTFMLISLFNASSILDRLGVMFSSVLPSFHCSVHSSVRYQTCEHDTTCFKRVNRFCCKLTQVIYGAKRRNDQQFNTIRPRGKEMKR